MISYPLAVLKFTWSDTPWQGDHPSGLPYNDALVNQLYLPLARDWGVVGYWRQATFDFLNLEGGEIFPWRKLNDLPAPTPAAPYARAQVTTQAIQQALAEQWPLDRFKGIVVLIAPRDENCDAGATSFGAWPVCLVQMGDSQFFCAHEVGHALGFQHTMGPTPGAVPVALGAYNDPYCVIGDGSSRAPVPPPPAGPSASDNYWSWVAPLPSAASLCAWLPGFIDDTRHVGRAGSVTSSFRRTLRLRARDLDRSGGTPYPVALVAEVPGGGQDTSGLGQGPPPSPSAWIVELRRGAGWDRGFGRPGGAPTGVVVHSLRRIDEYPNDGIPDFRSRAVYEGIVRLQLPVGPNPSLGDWTAGDADARFGNGAFVVAVEEVADDLSWAEITLGGPLLGRDGTVSGHFGMADGIEASTSEDGFAEHVPVFICNVGDFHYTLFRRSVRLKSVAAAFGYDQPVFSWAVNGVKIPVPAPFALNPSVAVPVMAHFPLPAGGEIVVPKTARVRYEQLDNQLVLIGDAADGTYTLEIEVTASESAPGAVVPTPASVASGHGKMDGVVIKYESAYDEALAACIKRLREIDHRFSKSRRGGIPRLIRPEDPASVRFFVLNQIRQDLVTSGNIALAERLGGVLVNLESALRLTVR